MAPKIIQFLMKSKYHFISGRNFILFFIIFCSCHGLPTETENICRTLECNQTASRILEFMDATVNPCENFYKFACGNYVKNTKIPDDREEVDTITDLIDQVQEQLKTFVEVKISPNMSQLSKRVKTYYDICMNETAIEKNGLNPLKDKFKKLGGWPVLEGTKWNEDAFNWTNSIHMLYDLGYNFGYFMSFDFNKDIKNRTETIVLTPPSLPILAFPHINLSDVFEDEKVNSYKKAMINVAVLLGADRKYAEIELKKSLEFEAKLANMTLKNQYLVNFNSSLSMTVAELNRYYPIVSWVELLNYIYQPYVNVNENTTIINLIPFYLTDLKGLLNVTSKKTLANYILWRVFLESVDYLSDEYQRPILEFEETALNIQKPNTIRSERCFQEVLKYLNHNIGVLYVRNYSKEDDKKSVTEMVMNIKSQLKTTLQRLDWMDGETKKLAIEKVDAMKSNIAYNDQLLDEHEMNEIYKNFELHENNSYLDTMLNIKLFGSYFFRIMKKYRDQLQLNPLKVGASFLVDSNSIQIPAAILQGRIYNADRPKYINYGAIGVTLAHEITHGFDTSGKYEDKNGDYSDLYESLRDKELSKKVKCFTNQYDNYTVKEIGMNINGSRTINDNIADIGGYKLAYLTYKNWTSLNGPEPRLPGLEHFSPTQMFWISAAQNWCTVQRPEFMIKNIKTDVHSPPEFRVIGPLSNLKEFSDDFQCPLESPMNPEDKCTFW